MQTGAGIAGNIKLPALKAQVESAGDPLLMADRLAAAGNAIDMGINRM